MKPAIRQPREEEPASHPPPQEPSSCYGVDPADVVAKTKELRTRPPKAYEVLVGALDDLAKGGRDELVLDREDALVLIHRLNTLAGLATKARTATRAAQERAARIAQRSADEVDQLLEWGRRIQARMGMDQEDAHSTDDQTGG